MFFGPLMLTAAIVSEVIGTLALRASDGFSRPLPTVVVVAGYVLSFIAMAQALKELPLGLVYAVWAGTGTAIIALAGIAMFGETATMLKMASLALIILGVVGLNLSGAH